MIISIDHKGLEWVTAVYLSQDKVGIQEIWDGADQHEDNRQRFGLPTRLIAKTFLFRLIYGGSAFSYAHDPEFIGVSDDVDFWQRVIDEFYSKYSGLYAWHQQLLEDVGKSGRYVSPSGRIYNFKPYRKGTGEWVLPRTKILNYPVQGLGADIVMLSRISLWRRFQSASDHITPILTKFVNTVHDDIWLDTPNEYSRLETMDKDGKPYYYCKIHWGELKGIDKNGNTCYNICSTVKSVFEDLPANFERAFKTPFNLPCRYEIKTLTGEPVLV